MSACRTHWRLRLYNAVIDTMGFPGCSSRPLREGRSRRRDAGAEGEEQPLLELEAKEFAVGDAQSGASGVAKVGWEERFRRVPRSGASSEFPNVIVTGTYRTAGLVWEIGEAALKTKSQTEFNREACSKRTM